MTRLYAIPPHLSGNPAYEGDPVRVAVIAELRALRAALSLSAARMVPTSASILSETAWIERVVVELKELAGRV